MEGYPVPLPTTRTEKEKYNEVDIKELPDCFWPGGGGWGKRLEVVNLVFLHFYFLDFSKMFVIYEDKIIDRDVGYSHSRIFLGETQ